MTVEPQDTLEQPTLADADDARIGRAFRRLVELAGRDAALREGLEALARAILGLAPPEAIPRSPGPEREDAPRDRALGEGGEPDDVEPDEHVEPMDAAALRALVTQASAATGADEFGPIGSLLRRVVQGEDQQDGRAVSARPDDVAPPSSAGPTVAAASAADAQEARGWDATDLPRIAERARLKAALSRAAAERATSGVPLDEALVHRARSAGAEAWMLDREDVEPEAWATLAACYDAVADGADLAALLAGQEPLDRAAFERVIRALAAVQSGLRVTVARFTPLADEDQAAAFTWLKVVTRAEHIFLERHMRLDDPLDPARVAEVAAPLRAELEAWLHQAERSASRRRGLRQVRYHAERLKNGKGTAHDQEKIVEAVSELVADGLPPSNLELRRMLLPIVDRLAGPADAPAGYARVVADLELNREPRRREADDAAVRRARAPGDDEREAEVLLRGRDLVLIGGERRIEAERALRDAFGLAGLAWFTLSDDPTIPEIEREVARPEVAVVVQLIRWSRHRYGDAREIAERYGKPFVRVPGGYNPAAIAHAVIDQASERLRASGPRSSSLMARPRRHALPDTAG